MDFWNRWSVLFQKISLDSVTLLGPIMTVFCSFSKSWWVRLHSMTGTNNMVDRFKIQFLWWASAWIYIDVTTRPLISRMGFARFDLLDHEEWTIVTLPLIAYLYDVILSWIYPIVLRSSLDGTRCSSPDAWDFAVYRWWGCVLRSYEFSTNFAGDFVFRTSI